MFLNQARRIASSSGAGLVAPRIAPLVVHFYGDSGVGKSSMLSYLNADVLFALGSRDPSDLHDKVYYRRPDSEDLDGYRNGTQIVVCDDFGSVKDSAARPNPQVGEAIHMANTAHFPLSMAHLEDKGTTIFDAAMVVWTTNRSHFAFESMTNPEAVSNRVQLKFRQHVDPEYQVVHESAGKTVKSIDRKKLERALASNPTADREILRFDLVDPTSKSEVVLSKNMSYEDMSKLVLEKLEECQNSGKKYLTRQKNYFGSKIAKACNPTAPPTINPQDQTATFRNAQGLFSYVTDTCQTVCEYFYDPVEHFTMLDMVTLAVDWDEVTPVERQQISKRSGVPVISPCYRLPRSQAVKAGLDFVKNVHGAETWTLWASKYALTPCDCTGEFDAKLFDKLSGIIRNHKAEREIKVLRKTILIGGALSIVFAWILQWYFDKQRMKSQEAHRQAQLMARAKAQTIRGSALNQELYQPSVLRGRPSNQEVYQASALRGVKTNQEVYHLSVARGVKTNHEDNWGSMIPRAF